VKLVGSVVGLVLAVLLLYIMSIHGPLVWSGSPFYKGALLDAMSSSAEDRHFEVS